MADFCAPCTRGGLPGNDLDGWLAGSPGYAWAMCEGCGSHLFDNAGERFCRDEVGLSPAGGMAACPRCDSAALAPSFRFATVPASDLAEHPAVKEWLTGDVGAEVERLRALVNGPWPEDPPSERDRIEAALPVGSRLIGSPLSRIGLPEVNPPGLAPVDALVMGIARGQEGRCCFNCETPVAFRREGDGPYSLMWRPFVVLAGADGGLTVVCVPCFDPA